MTTEFINISAKALTALLKAEITDYDRKVYLVLAKNATFKYNVYGVYRKQTYSTLAGIVNAATDEDKAVIHLQRSLKRLEKSGLAKTLNSKSELIITLDPTATLATVVSAIENDREAFNIFQQRIDELASNLKIAIKPVKRSVDQLSELDDIEVPLFPGDLLNGHLGGS
ncbi:hypothetical protein [Xylophilus ampelinus]|uniref:hypothetical protein n=1 Tax=Xylophilus ampelinus TaxID=54067 RepID=UPI0011B3C5D3|nr:hypothetical protein [Xylophilus ampelinus]MCS4510383.1 hypothetical protein [Xylophilus ampelinus]